MIIQCILKREGGTLVQMEQHTYHFKPTPRDPRHLAEVLIQAHAERFLSISEGYRMADGTSPAQAEEELVNLEGKLTLSTAHASQFELKDGSMISLFELTEHAFRESAMTLQEWNNQDDEDLYEALDNALAELNEEALAELSKGGVMRPKPEPIVEEDDDEDDEEAQRRREEEDEEQERLEREELARTLEAQRVQAEADEAERLRLAEESNDDDNEEGAGTEETTPPPVAPETPAAPAPTATAPVAAPAATEAPGDDQAAIAAHAAERAELSERYEKLMGRKPNHRMANERIRAVLDQEAE